MPKAQIKRLEDLRPDSQNDNEGTKRGADVLASSLEKLGAGRSILVDKNGIVIAGNKTLEAAVDLGLGVKVVSTRGHELVVVQREDLDLSTDPRARELAIADNRASEVGLKWNAEMLALHQEDGADLGAFFFSDELARIMGKAEQFAKEASALGVMPADLPREASAPAPAPEPEPEPAAPPARRQAGEPVIGYNIVFDEDAQQQRWYAFLRYLRARYQDEPTLGSRLDRYLREFEAANLQMKEA